MSCGIGPCTIFVRRYDDDDDNKKTVKVDVDQTEKITTVTALVAEELGFNIAMEKKSTIEFVDCYNDESDIDNLLRIRYGTDDDIVENPMTTTFRDLGIKNNDVLTIEQRFIIITIVEDKTKEISMLIDPNSSVQELKSKISMSSLDRRESEGNDYFWYCQKLSLVSTNNKNNNATIELSDNNKMCADYGIMMGSVLNLDSPSKEKESPKTDGGSKNDNDSMIDLTLLSSDDDDDDDDDDDNDVVNLNNKKMIAKWKCPKCTVLNSKIAPICIECQYNPIEDEDDEEIDTSSDIWNCPACTLINPKSSSICSVCGESVPTRHSTSVTTATATATATATTNDGKKRKIDTTTSNSNKQLSFKQYS